MNEESERVAAVILAAIIATTVVPALAPRLAASAGVWLREHAILVDGAHAVFTLPFLGVGPDARRLGICVFLLIAGLAWQAWTKRKAPRDA